MFEIFASLFDTTLLTWRLTPQPTASPYRVTAYATLNTAIRVAALGGFTYGAIRVVATAVSHGPF